MSKESTATKPDAAAPKGKGELRQWVRGLTGNIVSLGLLYGISAALGLELYAGIALGIQWAVFAVHGYPQSSEKFYDASGSLTHLAVVLASLLSSDAPSRRQVLLSVCAVMWLTRLGSFLFTRIMKDGKDNRFTKLKQNPLRFLTCWSVQALRVFLIELPVLIVNSQTVDVGGKSLQLMDLAGFSIFVFGFLFEVIADAQKTAFRAQPANRHKFITTGLWALSRHPNYFGEIVMWTGVALASTSSYSTGLEYLGYISPVFTTFLLTKVSGVPMLERIGNKKWGDDPEYVAYMKSTPCIVPWPR